MSNEKHDQGKSPQTQERRRDSGKPDESQQQRQPARGAMPDRDAAREAKSTTNPTGKEKSSDQNENARNERDDEDSTGAAGSDIDHPHESAKRVPPREQRPL